MPLQRSPAVGLAFAIKSMNNFRAVDPYEVELGFAGDSPGDQGLASPRGSIEKHAFWSLDAQLFKDLGILKGSSTISRTSLNSLITRRYPRRRPAKRSPGKNRVFSG